MDRTGFEREKVIALIPAFNEEGNAVRVIKEIPREAIDEVVVIDDGSVDQTPFEVAQAGATVLRHKERQGIGAAIRTGIKYVLENNFTVIVVMAGNGKDDPHQITGLVELIIQDSYDYVQGSRYIEGGYYGKMPLHRFLFTKAYSFAVQRMMGFLLTDGTSGFRHTGLRY